MTGAHSGLRRVRAFQIGCPIVMAASPMEKTTPVITTPAANASDAPITIKTSPSANPPHRLALRFASVRVSSCRLATLGGAG